MGFYGNRFNLNIDYCLNIFISESESFNVFISELELSNENVNITEAVNLKSIGEYIKNIFKKILDGINNLIDFIKKAFNKIIFRKAEEKIKETEKTINKFEQENDNGDKSSEIRKKIGEINKRIQKILYQDTYIFIDTSKLFYDKAVDNLSLITKETEKIFLKRLKDQKFDWYDGSGLQEYIDSINFSTLNDSRHITLNDCMSDFVKDNIDYGKNNIDFDSNKLLDDSKSIIKKLLSDNNHWEKTHYVKDGYPDLFNYCKIYRNYCKHIENNSIIYTKYLNDAKSNIEKIRSIALSSFNYDINKKESDYQLYHKIDQHILQFLKDTCKYLQFNINYVNYLVNLDIKGIKSGAILLGKINSLY